MKLHRQLLTAAVAAALFVPAAHAEVAIDVIGGSEITFKAWSRPTATGSTTM